MDDPSPKKKKKSKGIELDNNMELAKLMNLALKKMLLLKAK